MQLYPYTDTWDDQDPHANFKADVAHYTLVDPLPTLEGLSRATGVPVPCLIRYVLVKYAASNSDALLAMGPLVLRQMAQHIADAEAADTAQARLKAYEALRQMVSWLQEASLELFGDSTRAKAVVPAGERALFPVGLDVGRGVVDQLVASPSIGQVETSCSGDRCVALALAPTGRHAIAVCRA